MQIPFCVMKHVLSNKLLAEEVDPQHDAATRSDSLVRNDSSTCCIVLGSILWLEEFSIADYGILQAIQDAATTDIERSCLNWSFGGFMKPRSSRGRKFMNMSTRYWKCSGIGLKSKLNRITLQSFLSFSRFLGWAF
jgi:hypothetical protein